MLIRKATYTFPYIVLPYWQTIWWERRFACAAFTSCCESWSRLYPEINIWFMSGCSPGSEFALNSFCSDIEEIAFSWTSIKLCQKPIMLYGKRKQCIEGRWCIKQSTVGAELHAYVFTGTFNLRWSYWTVPLMFINIIVYRNRIFKDLLYDKVIVLIIIILVLIIFIIVVTTVTLKALRKISCITLHWKCSISVSSHLCSQGYSKAPATSMFAGSPLIFRGVIWSLAPGRMGDGLWTCRWLMLTSQDILQMESGTLWVGW